MMMKKTLFFLILFTFFLIPCFQAAAQSAHASETTAVFDTTGFPQWAKDLRRFDIIAFGSFPFSMFFVNFFYDMYRWNNANGMDFSAEGRRYAPWPFKSAGGVDLTTSEFRRTLFLAAGVSMTIALADLIIVLIKRDRERKMEIAPTGTYTIERMPLGTDNEDFYEIIDTDDYDYDDDIMEDLYFFDMLSFGFYKPFLE